MMNIENKFNIGDEVFYPAADLRTARIMKGEVKSIILVKEGDKLQIAYNTGSSYGVKQEDVFDNAEDTKARLLSFIREQAEKSAKEIEEAIVTIEESKTEDLIQDLTASYAEASVVPELEEGDEK